MAQLSGKPLYILDESAKKDQDALSMNVEAITAVAESIQTTIGPKGMNKMLVDSLGEITVTNDGSKILEEMQIEHPAAKMLLELTKAMKKNVGDGCSSAVLLTGELMKKTQEMVSVGISPTFIYRGYNAALNEIKHILDEIAVSIDIEDHLILQNVVISALNSKMTEGKELFAQIIVDAILKIKDIRAGSVYIDLDNIQIIKKQGEGITDSRLIEGIVIDKEVVNPMMPKSINGAKIALLDGALEIVKTDISSGNQNQKSSRY